MTINIFTALNGVGLQSDYELLNDLLKDRHEIRCYDLKKAETVLSSDISIHLEVPRFEYLHLSKRNIFIPNPEWFYPHWTHNIKGFTEIWAKTKDCQNIFPNSIFSGFMSKDLHLDNIPKRKVLIHIAGKSHAKNTDALCEAYRIFPDLPKCFLISSDNYSCNGNLIPCGRLNEAEFNFLLNSSMIHICTSAYEGWGHYLHEALSVGSVIITTDSAPMNEVITDNDYLVKPEKITFQRLGKMAVINPKQLYEKIMQVWEKSNNELIEAGAINRIKYLDECNQFKEFLNQNI